MKSDYILLFAIALLIRLSAAWFQQQPNYMDAAYSYVNALNLAEGRGFVEDFVWNYLDNPEPPPHPSHLYWMPLTSILAWLGMIVGGASYRAAQIPFIVLSALLAPISYWTAYALSTQRWHGWLAGLFAVFSGLYFPFWTAIDNFTPFAVAGSLALLFAWRGMEIGDWRLEIGAGVLVGLAHLARADGPLLLIVIVLTYLLHMYHLSRITHHASRITHHVLRFTFYLALGYLFIITPWFIRNWQVVGTALPVAGSQTIWLITANDLFSSYAGLFSYGQELSAQSFLAQGFGPIIQGRWWVLVTNLQTVLAAWGMIFLAPLAVIGIWHMRHHFLIQLAGLYALLLFAVMTIIFAFPGALGGLFHSGAALLPFIYAVAVIGLDDAVDWIAARRRRWNAPAAKQFFGVGLVIMAIALSSFIYYRRVLKNNTWNNADHIYPTIAAWVAQQNPTATVMINNPPAYRYHGGGLSIVVPNENIETILQVAHHYQADYLILDRNRPAPLTKIYDDPTSHPVLSLVQTFAQGTSSEIYVFEIIR